MFRSVKWRAAVIFGILGLCASSLYDNYQTEGSIVRLGLDLSGGMHLVLGVDDPEGTMSPEERSEAIDVAGHVIRNRIDGLGIAEPIVQKVGSDRLIVEIAGVDDEAQAREVIGRTASLEWRSVRGLPALDGPLRPLAPLLRPGSSEGEFLVAAEDFATVRRLLELPEAVVGLPRDVGLHWSTEPTGGDGRTFRVLYALDRDPLLTGAMLEDATAVRDSETNQAVVRFELSRAGGNRFWEVTGQHLGDQLAIVLDGEVVSAPFVNARIGSRGVIELNHARMEDARDLALVLRAGALPAPLTILEERTVGPSLGQESIDRGRIAGLVGLGLVGLVMVGYYGAMGVLAVVALSVYVVLLLGGLAGLNRTLTLPGIAGIILSIGMAVDANVLVFERIREELAAGKRRMAAVDAGFRHAFSAIVDANITTLITALVLFYIGTGPVRGFAVTLSIGLIASFFTAVYVTRTLFLLWPEGWAGLPVAQEPEQRMEREPSRRPEQRPERELSQRVEQPSERELSRRVEQRSERRLK